MAPLNLAISPCPNDTFAFHALAHGLVPGAPPVSVTFADIDVLNTRAADGLDDLVKVSYAALPWLLDRYRLLPSGGALGRGCGPLVLMAEDRGASRIGETGGGGDADVLRGARVAIPGTRTTAYLLFRLWAAGVDVASIDVLPFEKIMPAVRDGRYDAGLVIHESRFTYPSYGLVSVADLGDWWEGATGLPIPLGAILARRDLPAGVGDLGGAVRGSVAAAFADRTASADWVLAHSQELAPEVVEAHIDLYVNGFSLDLGDEGYAAVEELLGRAATANLVPPLPTPLR
ncbi:1,4-dihydroxy-6-naphthoate synthase [Frankia sp. CNm7]|uniref:1,4-dihydroxy-6-naphtoate synthase n=1 Tax=Frankia nepalensis TaxID=1836974 RepID=A0A937RIU0_9ACTN|nr:1,4-dihydroxy-6-naphthoate synthase [Frankia nepalensis]MBL7516116.1 1,4-dihydroxy-6-naphthoate synthase [Frankia nepalensis]MBL7521361.1 1,4-dihydroxy-6-naphthoate synthase [Frankia nepalensis]MBL7628134.1 1,4-dihydroxy-6-naphthoate synthase [Frankia nepalensis]